MRLGTVSLVDLGNFLLTSGHDGEERGEEDDEVSDQLDPHAQPAIHHHAHVVELHALVDLAEKMQKNDMT